MKNTIPVAFSFDDNFTLPAWVAVKSLIDNAARQTRYHIFIMYSSLSEENIALFSAFYCCGIMSSISLNSGPRSKL